MYCTRIPEIKCTPGRGGEGGHPSNPPTLLRRIHCGRPGGMTKCTAFHTQVFLLLLLLWRRLKAHDDWKYQKPAGPSTEPPETDGIRPTTGRRRVCFPAPTPPEQLVYTNTYCYGTGGKAWYTRPAVKYSL